MEHKKTLTRAAVAAVVALGMSALAQSALAGKPGMEKCAGIVKAGKNDCGTSAHACAGQSKKDGAADEWVYVPTGTCNKIVGGKVKPSEPKKK